jgi:iron complex outermembrane receptor protein
MVFGRIAKGFKSGGFPLEAPTLAQAKTPFSPEESTSYEVGVKGASNMASYSATVFVTKLKNQQISYLPVGGTSPTTTNAGASTYSGLELEGAFKVSKDTKIQVGYGYLSAKFDEFLSPGLNGSTVDAASNLEVGYAPKHTFNLNLESNLAKTEYGRLKGLVEYRYTGAYYNYAANKVATAANANAGNLAADSRMSALGTINARLTLDQIPVGGPGQADASIWVKNATNKQVMQNMMDVGGYYQVGYWSAPRTLGVTLNYKW